jgi:hypothetical protein
VGNVGNRCGSRSPLRPVSAHTLYRPIYPASVHRVQFPLSRAVPVPRLCMERLNGPIHFWFRERCILSIGQGRAVKDRFKADEWNTLTPRERVRRCPRRAAEAQALADKASPELKQIYQNMADQWATLAREIAHHSNLAKP